MSPQRVCFIERFVFFCSLTKKNLKQKVHYRIICSYGILTERVNPNRTMEKNPTKIVVYHCTNLRLFHNGNQKKFARERPGISIVAVPCSGKVEAHHLLKTMASGAQGVMVLACGEKACRYLEGSMRSKKRVEYAKEWLVKLGIEPERFRFIHVPPMDIKALDSALKEFAAELQSFGNTPPIAKNQTELTTNPR